MASFSIASRFTRVTAVGAGTRIQVQPDSRVLRGASWNNNDPNNLLSSNRNNNTPTNRNNNNGFRVVLVGSGERKGWRAACKMREGVRDDPGAPGPGGTGP